jgi:hypothetical protein
MDPWPTQDPRSFPTPFESFKPPALSSIEGSTALRSSKRLMTSRTPLGVKAMDRERAFVDRSADYRFNPKSKIQNHWGDAYAGVFGSNSEALSLENTIFWDENAETAET